MHEVSPPAKTSPVARAAMLHDLTSSPFSECFLQELHARHSNIGGVLGRPQPVSCLNANAGRSRTATV